MRVSLTYVYTGGSTLVARTAAERNGLIQGYFDQDYKYREIYAFLKLVHGCQLLLDLLKRRLKQKVSLLLSGRCRGN